MDSQEIRNQFTSFFESKKHQKLASSSLVPENDPTLLFANAGMNQFKDFFTGKANPQNKRATTIQKCVRAGGKHNDLENVGFTPRHHTFFEMLGNFSFGDYFKRDAIEFAWEFLTEKINLDTKKLYVTVHDSDDEAEKIWLKNIGVPKERIFRLGDKDNFWEMGETGPCGPCSEIFYDHGEKFSTGIPQGKQLIEDEGRFIEIWNLVFMQFEKTTEKTLDLPNPSIDTGAGLERIAAILQGSYWNYDTDLFLPIIKEIEKASGQSYGDRKFQSNMRVIADHVRAATMLITDGVIPSNEGRGYVLRRIIRRGVRHIRELGIKELIMADLVSPVFKILGDEYPQNLSNQATAKKMLDLEERKFLETLDTGIKYLNESLKTEVEDKTFSGAAAFKLYDTYGFPRDLTEVILRERGLKLDNAGFDSSMEKQKETSRKSWKGGGGAVDNSLFHSIKEKHGITDFTGYKSLEEEAKLIAIEGKNLVFDKTPFYAEGGGQAGDKGVISQNGNVLSIVEDCLKPVEGLHIHVVDSEQKLQVGKTYTLTVDKSKRSLTARNHSATHLLQAALIEVLGDHVKQAGSSVNHEKLRFDFTHPEAISKENLSRIEKLINQKIQEKLPVSPSLMSKDEALSAGAVALFGEKYGDQVRVLKMGDFSIELCGGTHVDNTFEIGFFKILSESSLSSGVRRIEATSSQGAFDYLQARDQLLSQVEDTLKAKGKKLEERSKQILDENKKLQKLISELKDKVQTSQNQDLFSNLEELSNKIKFKSAQVKGGDLRKISDQFVDKFHDAVLLLFSESKGKLAILIRTHKKNKNINCSKILQETLTLINGRGGGKPDMAQGSGDLIEDTSPIIEKVKSLIQ